MIVNHVDGAPYVTQDVPYAVFDDPATTSTATPKPNQVAATTPLYADA